MPSLGLADILLHLAYQLRDIGESLFVPKADQELHLDGLAIEGSIKTKKMRLDQDIGFTLGIKSRSMTDIRHRGPYRIATAGAGNVDPTRRMEFVVRIEVEGGESE